MTVLEAMVVGLVVAAAAAYLVLRVRRVLAGGACGCGAPVGKGCPAARRVTVDLERLARDADAGVGRRAH